MRKPLTERQDQIFNYIQERIKQDGYPPTIREIGGQFGFSEKAAHDHLNALQRKKYIKRAPGKPRTIAILGEMQQEIIEIPIYGRVAAGEPLLASQNIEDTLPIPKRMVNTHDCFALRIIGHSMIGIGILEGDFVIVRAQANADPGDIVVALLEDEATVKRFYPEGDRIRLQPENPSIEPSIVDADVVQVLGKVIGVHREM